MTSRSTLALVLATHSLVAAADTTPRRAEDVRPGLEARGGGDSHDRRARRSVASTDSTDTADDTTSDTTRRTSNRSTTAPARRVTEQEIFANVFHTSCIACHGKLEKQAGLDLRTRESLLRGGKSGPALLPGKPSASLVYRRIHADEMPPKRSLFGDTTYVYRVRADDIERLRRWIAAGAPPAAPDDVETPPSAGVARGTPQGSRPPRWFRPPERPRVPAVRDTARVRTPIDAFLLRRLQERGLSFAPEQDRAALLRRACFALTGLPPSPRQVEELLADRRPDAYERSVDELLRSPRYGERWAKHWLDAAGYADTHGKVNRDELRPFAWRYRDYVIRAFNDDKPYDRFLLEQIAGDELFDRLAKETPTPAEIDGLIATGFLRTAADDTDEGAFNKIENRFLVLADQIKIFSSSVMGLTLDCARCHDHKHDPIPQRDYYRFAAIFRAAYDPYDWRIPNVVLYPPKLFVPRRYQRYVYHPADREPPAIARRNAPLRAEIDKLEARLAAAEAPYRERFARSPLEFAPEVVAHYRFESDGPAVRDSVDDSIDGDTTGARSDDAPDLGEAWGENRSSLSLAGGQSAVIRSQPFIFHDPSAGGEPADAAVELFIKPTRTEPGKHVSVFWTTTSTSNAERFNVHLTYDRPDPSLGGDFKGVDDGSAVATAISRTTHRVRAGEWTHVAILRRDLGGGKLRYEWYFDGEIDASQTAEVSERHPRSRQWTIGGRRGFELDALIDEVRLWRGPVSPDLFLAAGAKRYPPGSVLAELRRAVVTPAPRRRSDQRRLLEEHRELLEPTRGRLEARFPEFRELAARTRERTVALRRQMSTDLRIHGIYDVPGEPTPVHVLRRGDPRSPGARVEPGVPAVLRDGIEPYRVEKPRWSTDTSGARLALARWLIQPRHPLTARVLVNRIWQHHTGRGLVSTAANFGGAGAAPSHPELLDWLATELVRSGWSVKRLQRLIVTSTFYRQASAPDARREAADPDNALLSRFPFRRLDAEAIRDSMLAIAGRLDETPFGPADELIVSPDGEVSGKPTPRGYRRSIYLAQRRSKPVTTLELFDAPPLLVNCIRRTESTVPTQALQLLNSDWTGQLAGDLAGRVARSSGDAAEARIERVFMIAYGRRPALAETRVALAGLRDLEAAWRRHLTTAPSPGPAGETREADVRRRALQSFCLAVLNSPELLYID